MVMYFLRGNWVKYGCQPKNRGKKPKMDGENNGSKPYEQMDDLGGFPIFFGNAHIVMSTSDV